MSRGWQFGITGLLIAAAMLLEWGGIGLRALWPSVAALVLVFTTRKVLLGLFGGAVIGSLILMDGHFWKVPFDLVDQHLLPNFQSAWKSGAIVFTLLLGGFVHLLERGGMLQALLVRLLHGQSPRKVEAGAGLFGLICFFDGLANSLMVGRIFQPMADRAGVSRVRLAYIVDTTSAAVACLAFVSTWIAYQLAMIREGFTLAGRESLAEPYHLFFQSLPHNYYAWFALLLMAVVIWRQWNIGPMADPRFRACTGSNPGNMAMVQSADEAGLWRAWVPVAVLMVMVFAGIYTDGTRALGKPLLPLEWDTMAMAFAEANVPVILVAASAAGAILAWALFPRGPGREKVDPGGVFMEGMLQLFQPVPILVMAWMLGTTLNQLEAADYLGQLLGERVPPALFPTTVFLTGAVVAFSTGTSWGTMGLLMPLAIPLAFAVGGSDTAGLNLMPMVIGAVFSGAVFGDHCSPISDTTIVSSIACGVDPIDHVRTQLPYALLAAAGAAFIGFPLAGLTGGALATAVLSVAAFTGLTGLGAAIFHRGSSEA